MMLPILPGTTPIELTTSSSDVADQEQFFFTQADGEGQTEEQTFGRKEQSRKKATEWVAHEEPYQLRPRSKNSQRLTETLRRTPYTESRQMHGYH